MQLKIVTFLIFSAVLFGQNAVTTQEPIASVPKPLEPNEREPVSLAMINLQSAQMRLLQFRAQHPELSALEQEVSRLQQSYASMIAKLRKEHNASDECDLTSDKQWVDQPGTAKGSCKYAVIEAKNVSDPAHKEARNVRK